MLDVQTSSSHSFCLAALLEVVYLTHIPRLPLYQLARSMPLLVDCAADRVARASVRDPATDTKDACLHLAFGHVRGIIVPVSCARFFLL